MDIRTVLNSFAQAGPYGAVPAEAVEEAGRQREAIAPALLENMGAVCAKLGGADGELPAREELALNGYGIYLLSEARDTRAFPLLLRELSADDEQVSLLGDYLADHGEDFLYSTFDGDPAPAMALAADTEKSPFSRIAVLRFLAQLAMDGTIFRAEFVSLMRDILRRAADAVEPGGSAFSGSGIFLELCVHVIAHAHLCEISEDVRTLYLLKKIKGPFQTFPEFLDTQFRSEKPCAKVITSALYALSGGTMGSEKPREEQKPAEEERPEEDSLIVLTYNVGRNDPCPCGSGKKFKKCCLPKKQDLLAARRSPAPSPDPAPVFLPDPPAEEGPYPPLNGSRGLPGLYNFYSEDAVAVDRPAYDGMELLRSSGAREKLTVSALNSLWDAFVKFRAVCEKNGLKTPGEFDRDHRVHYLSREWLEPLAELLRQKEDPRLAQVQAVLDA